MMRRWTAVLAATLALAGAGSAVAHEGHSHGSKLMGTVKAVDASRVDLTTKDGKTTTFYVSPATRYLKGTAASSLADLKPGTRVVVDTKVEGEKTMATTVKLGEAPATGDKGTAHPH